MMVAIISVAVGLFVLFVWADLSLKRMERRTHDEFLKVLGGLTKDPNEDIFKELLTRLR